MRKRNSVGIGPGAASLILIFVMLSISVLAVLSLMNSRGDADLSRRSAETVRAVRLLNAEAEETFAGISEELIGLKTDELPEKSGKAEVTGLQVSWSEDDGTRELACAAEAVPDESGTVRKLVWSEHKLSTNIGGDAEEWN